MENTIIYHNEKEYAGWPANKGAWSWDDEFLVGFTVGRYGIGGIHNCLPPFRNIFARSLNAGKTWSIEEPKVNWSSKAVELDGFIDTNHPDLIFRFGGSFDHSSKSDDSGSYFISYDRGKTWSVAYKLIEPPENWYGTARTDYIKELFMGFVSLGHSKQWGLDLTLCVIYNEDTYRWEQRSQIGDINARSVMPASAYINKNIVVAIRRRAPYKDQCWIEIFKSKDLGFNWKSVGVVAETGGVDHNGNPPALIESEGKLILAYGKRHEYKMMIKTSLDDGETWGDEICIRDNFYDNLSCYGDLGYPRLLKDKNNNVTCIYYWASEECKQQHIVCTKITL